MFVHVWAPIASVYFVVHFMRQLNFSTISGPTWDSRHYPETANHMTKVANVNFGHPLNLSERVNHRKKTENMHTNVIRVHTKNIRSLHTHLHRISTTAAGRAWRWEFGRHSLGTGDGGGGSGGTGSETNVVNRNTLEG